MREPNKKDNHITKGDIHLTLMIFIEHKLFFLKPLQWYGF